MEKLKTWFGNRWFRRAAFVILGALLGFAYYYFIGCASGTCPITSNPYISTGYGSLLGLALSSGTGGTASGKQTRDAG